MKKIIIISLGIETGKSLTNQLKYILNQNININTYSIDKNIPNDLNCDLIIFSSDTVRDIILSKQSVNSKYIVVKRVIKHESIDTLINIPRGKDVLVVNDDINSCETVIRQFKNHGIDQINYYPYYPGIKEYKKLDICITPGESKLVPSCIKKVIDIGPREMDITSIAEVLINIDSIDEYGEILSSYFFKSMVDVSKRYIDKANQSNKLKDILSNILDNSKEGIIYTNTKDEVLVFNKKSLDILNLHKENIISKNIYEVCKELLQDIATINDDEVFISRQPLYNDNLLVGYIITIDPVKTIEKMDEELRRKKKDKKMNAKYTFDDMVGNTIKTLKSINLYKKISKTNSTVLIQGESGTGKEILAQSIHNYSDRSDYPFIAINFAALSESLLESELFGYEDGAFTGAKKGGKVGLFKKAHKGTIFLDEIGDAPYHFQARLLRVLQEREVTPVGSTETIPIDVRVIAATNKDLLKEVENKNFREDLFYRLNVMPISTIPLRDRKEDIEVLIKYYLKKNNVFISLNDFLDIDALNYMKSYNWPGNIRELINIVEYLINIREDEKLKIEDLPVYMKKDNVTKDIEISNDIIWVLNKLDKYEKIGRRSLAIIAKEEGVDLGEGKLRTLMSKMQDTGLIKINKGVKGTEILSKGKEILYNL